MTWPEEYRVFLALDQADFPSALSRAREIFEKTRNKRQFFVVAPAGVLELLGEDFRPVAIPSGAGRSHAFARILRDFGDKDVVFVKSGLILPADWDVRLAWTARHFPGVATVSPVFNCDVGDTFADADAIDRHCYRRSRFALIETNEFQDCCVYVRGEAVRAVPPPSSDADADKQIRHFTNHLKRLRYSHLIADHIYAGDAPSDLKRTSLSAVVEDGHPAVRDFMRPRVLHLMHSWGGGLERWVREYCRADCEHDNLILRSSGTWGAFGQRLGLYRHIDDRVPAADWPLSPWIKSTDTEHDEYRAVLTKIVSDYGIEAILISSLIGHSLDALRSGLPTAMVCHDYYPFCPALNITFSKICESCNAGDLAACTTENPHHRFFRNTPPEQWLHLRSEFVKQVRTTHPVLIAPSPSVRDNYRDLAPDLAEHCRVIPHGSRPLPSAPLRLDPLAKRRLRVLVLGSLAPNKGQRILESIGKELRHFADLFLVGCGEFGRDYIAAPAVTVIREYRWESLPLILDEIQPDLALLPAVVPETFSFTLQELFELGIPTLASDLGSFHDRIEDGVNGFLCAPEPTPFLAKIKQLASDREALARVHRRLLSSSVRRVPEMLADYRDVLRAPSLSAKAYFCEDSRPPAQPIALGCCELRWDGGFARSTPFRPTSGRQTVALCWPEQRETFTGLELDPIGGPGVVHLLAARLLDRRGDPVWTWEGDPAAFGTAAPDIRLKLPVGVSELARLCAGGRLELDLEWPAAESLIHSVAHATASNGTAPPRIDVSTEQLASELASAKVRIADLETSLSWRLSRPLRTLGAVYLKARSSFKER